ncbi:MAG: cytochrome c family protein [Paracoccaceae bacterium]
MNRILATLAAVTLAAPAFADGHATGDAAAGEKVFNKCKSCHMIVSDAGETILKGGKTGPNLWGVFQRQPGSLDGFKYGKDLVAAGETMTDGWDEASFSAYVEDPRKWLRATLDNSKAKSKMSFKLKKAEDQADVWAYLVSVGPSS